MATFTDDEINLILSRGFQGSPFPIIPTPAFRRSQGNATFYQTDSSPQSIYNLGDAYGITQGLYAINQEVWRSAVTIESDDYYNTFNGIKLVVDPTGGANYVDIYVYMMNDFTTTLPTTVQQIDIKGDISIGTDILKLEGNMHLTLLYVDFDGSTDNVLRLALHCDNAHYYSASGSQYDFDIPNYCILMNQTQFIKNEPWHYLLAQGDPTWYDIESQVPESTEGGGGGGFYRASDTIGFSGLPALDILDFGCVSLYKMNTTNMRALSNFLWSTDFFDNIIKNWQSPFDNIISIGFVPLNSELTGVDTNISIGNVPTDITATKLSKSVIEKDFGRVNFKELYNNFADYAPFTKLQIYLPSVGVKDLNPDDYMDGALHLMCYIDCLSGTCVYQLKSIRHGREHVVDNYTGNVLTAIPITGRNFIDAYKGVMNGLSSVASGNIGGLVSSAFDIKPTYQKTGSVSGSSTRLSVHTPYIFFDTAQLRQPKYFREQHGYVSNQTKRLGDCTGYNEILYIDIDDLTAIDSEKDEILSLLKSGVYV